MSRRLLLDALQAPSSIRGAPNRTDVLVYCWRYGALRTSESALLAEHEGFVEGAPSRCADGGGHIDGAPSLVVINSRS